MKILNAFIYTIYFTIMFFVSIKAGNATNEILCMIGVFLCLQAFNDKSD